MQIQELKNVAPDREIHAISSNAHKGIKEVLRSLRHQVEESRKVEEQEPGEDDGLPVISLNNDEKAKAWEIEKTDDETGTTVYRVRGYKIEKFARRTNFEGYENVNRLRDNMKKMGITHELKRQGADDESLIRIGRHEFTLVEQ